jgi:hypothetical protein
MLSPAWAQRQLQPVAEQGFGQGVVADRAPEAIEQNAGATERLIGVEHAHRIGVTEITRH